MGYDVLHHMQYLVEYMYFILLLLFYFGFMIFPICSLLSCFLGNWPHTITFILNRNLWTTLLSSQ